MLFVLLFSWKPGLSPEATNEALARRAQWETPAGVKEVGEYWLSTPSPTVISIIEADEYEPLMEIGLAWGDFFDITTVPAITAEEGLKLGAQILQRLAP